MEKIIRLKIAAMMLFWFGIVWQSMVLMKYLPEIFSTGTIDGLTFEFMFDDVLLGIIFVPYTLFGHLIHIGAGYWISKGSKIAVIVGVGLSLYEIISFFVPEVNPAVLSFTGITIRVFFGIVIVLLVLGSKDLLKLKTENWRPWKHPKSSSHPKNIQYSERIINNDDDPEKRCTRCGRLLSNHEGVDHPFQDTKSTKE